MVVLLRGNLRCCWFASMSGRFSKAHMLCAGPHELRLKYLCWCAVLLEDVLL